MKTVWGEGAATQVRGRARVADHLGVRAGRRRAQDLDAAAAHRSRRHRAVARRSRRGREPPRRFGARAGVRRARQRRRPISHDPQRLTQLAAALAELRAQNLVLAYHDRSDGGVFATLVEMAFAGHCGLDVKLPRGRRTAPRARCSREELGVVLQVKAEHAAAVHSIFVRHGLGDMTHALGAPTREMRVRIAGGRRAASTNRWEDLRRAWSETSFRMRELRDEPVLRARGIRRRLRYRRAGSQRRAHVRSERRRVRAVRRTPRGRKWRCCASRASTARSRWRPCSSAWASSRTTCT